MDYLSPNLKMYNVPYLINDEFNGMPYSALGSSGLRVSKVGLGTWKMGYPETGDGSRVNEKQAWEIFDRAIELGVTFWDTANRYNNGSGNSERLIGTWIKRNPEQRRNVILATKLFGGMDGTTPNHCGLSRSNILDSVYASMQRMQIEYIDLLYFHQYDPLSPIDESLNAIEDLVTQGLVRYFAVSNFTVSQLSEYMEWNSRNSGRTKIVAIQNQYDILHGESSVFPDVLAYSEQHGISYIAWSPLARGLLSNRYIAKDSVGRGDRLYDEGTLEKALDSAIVEKLKKLALLSQEWGIELSQLALSYVLTLPGMGPVIPSSSTVHQLESNAMAGKIILTDEQKQSIHEVIKI